MPTTIDSAGITFNDATSLTSAVLAANSVGATQITNGSVTAAKLGTTEQKQICKAWVNFNGTTSPGTIRSSYNVSSVTKTGTGVYAVNFTTTMTDSNYSSTVSCNDPIGGGAVNTTSFSTSSLQLQSIRISPTSPLDNSIISVQVFGN
jgi:hypothetical protein